MDWIHQHWQSLAALGIVAVTVVIFLRRAITRRGRSSCGGNCGCGTRKN